MGLLLLFASLAADIANALGIGQYCSEKTCTTMLDELGRPCPSQGLTNAQEVHFSNGVLIFAKMVWPRFEKPQKQENYLS